MVPEILLYRTMGPILVIWIRIGAFSLLHKRNNGSVSYGIDRSLGVVR